MTDDRDWQGERWEREYDERKQRIALLRSRVSDGEALTQDDAVWLLQQVEGGFWGRMAAGGMILAREARRHLLRVTRGVTKLGMRDKITSLSAKDWNEIDAMLAKHSWEEDDGSEVDQVP